MPSHSEPYTPPEPALSQADVDRLLADATAARESNERWAVALKAITLLAVGGLTAWNPAAGMAAGALLANLQRMLAGGEIDQLEESEWIRLIQQLLEQHPELRKGTS